MIAIRDILGGLAIVLVVFSLVRDRKTMTRSRLSFGAAMLLLASDGLMFRQDNGFSYVLLLLVWLLTIWGFIARHREKSVAS